MATWNAVEQAVKNGGSAQRNIWPPCKKIRLYRDDDADFFNGEFKTEDAIVCECDKPCDCIIGIWVPEEGDTNANDWHIFS